MLAACAARADRLTNVFIDYDEMLDLMYERVSNIIEVSDKKFNIFEGVNVGFPDPAFDDPTLLGIPVNEVYTVRMVRGPNDGCVVSNHSGVNSSRSFVLREKTFVRYMFRSHNVNEVNRLERYVWKSYFDQLVHERELVRTPSSENDGSYRISSIDGRVIRNKLYYSIGFYVFSAERKLYAVVRSRGDMTARAWLVDARECDDVSRSTVLSVVLKTEASDCEYFDSCRAVSHAGRDDKLYSWKRFSQNFERVKDFHMSRSRGSTESFVSHLLNTTTIYLERNCRLCESCLNADSYAYVSDVHCFEKHFCRVCNRETVNRTKGNRFFGMNDASYDTENIPNDDDERDENEDSMKEHNATAPSSTTFTSTTFVPLPTVTTPSSTVSGYTTPTTTNDGINITTTTAEPNTSSSSDVENYTTTQVPQDVENYTTTRIPPIATVRTNNTRVDPVTKNPKTDSLTTVKYEQTTPIFLGAISSTTARVSTTTIVPNNISFVANESTETPTAELVPSTTLANESSPTTTTELVTSVAAFSNESTETPTTELVPSTALANESSPTTTTETPTTELVPTTTLANESSPTTTTEPAFSNESTETPVTKIAFSNESTEATTKFSKDFTVGATTEIVPVTDESPNESKEIVSTTPSIDESIAESTTIAYKKEKRQPYVKLENEDLNTEQKRTLVEEWLKENPDYLKKLDLTERMDAWASKCWKKEYNL
ncbi:hypothetical protein QAD02_001429 [Eretmocerus hayati]|uniref:Uncharacterized protein n=1 Tax=Eretmocerus hayati TaxID=131215 RepID=A0ACC2NKS6_9HYME|nr:hypothetical protein QAD02_001429 [Eretmocerus hayati]